ncbi:MAG: baseplate J/gp47 family protein, partial [Chloroflexi bacterium]|nr:baseplate J/gp47 family protein [Chloroflexota bacterium]
MTTLPTFNELYDAGKSEIRSRNPDLTDFNEGSNLDAVTGAGAMLADEVLRYVIDLFAAQFVDTAEGVDLDALAADRFGLTRKPAAGAVGTVTFTRGGSSGVLTIPAGTTLRATVNGESVTFTTDDDVDMAAAETAADATATCTVTGATGNVAAGTVTTIVDAIPGDATATVTNADRFAGGAPEETDDAFRDRIRRFF